MHAQHGDTGIYGDDVPVGHVGRHSAAAALVNFAQGSDLPLHARGIQGGANMLHGLGRGIGSAGFTPGTGVLADGHTVVQGAVVPAVAGLCKIGVKGVGHVGGQAEGVGEALAQLHSLAIAEDLHKILKGMALHAADAHGADLLFVRQNAHGSVLGSGQVQDGLQLGVGADPIVVAIGTQQTPVQAHLPALAGGDHSQLRSAEVSLHHAVLLVEQPHDVQLHQVTALPFQGLGAQDHVQLLAGDALGQGLLHLVGSQVDQQIGDHQDGVILILADGHGDLAAVFFTHHAVDGQGHTGPLVLLDAAIVVGLEVGDLGIFVEGLGLQVQPGRVHMGGADVGALAHRLRADDSDQEALAPVVHIDLIPGLDLHAGDGGLEAVGLGGLGCPGSGLPLGLAGIHKGCIALAIFVHGLPLFGSVFAIAILGGIQQGFAQFVCGHGVPPSYFDRIPNVSKNAPHFL